MVVRLIIIILLTSLLLSCGEEPIPPTSTTSATTGNTQTSFSDTQTVFTYEPAISYLSGTIRKEVHFVPGGLSSTAKAVDDTAYALVLNKKITIRRTTTTDPLSHDTTGISIIQLTTRNIPLHNYAGKQVIIKGLLMQDPTPSSYYKMILVVQEVK